MHRYGSDPRTLCVRIGHPDLIRGWDQNFRYSLIRMQCVYFFPLGGFKIKIRSFECF